MASKAQFRANRTNARRSTGPRTAAGKSNSRQNALKHGACAKLNVVGDEDPQEFESSRAGVLRDLNPEDSLQHSFAINIADGVWRLQRIARFEAAVIRKAIEAAEDHLRRNGTKDRSLEELRAKLDAMRQRLEPARDHGSEAVLGSQGADLEVSHAQNMTGAEDAAERNAVEQLPVEARRESQEQAFSAIFSDNALTNLSRYQTALMGFITRSLVLFYRLKESRRAAEVERCVSARNKENSR